MVFNAATRFTAASKRFNRLLRRARARGLWRTLYALGRRVVQSRWCHSWWSLCAVDVLAVRVADLKRAERIPSAFEVRRAARQDTPALEGFCGPLAAIADRFDRGDRCVVTLADGRICAAVWLAVGPTRHDEDWGQLGCLLQLGAGIGLTYDGRGSRWGAWGSLMARLPQYLEAAGVTHVFTLVDCDNQTSLDNHRSLGYRPIGRIALVEVLRRAWSLYQTGRATGRMVRGRLGQVVLSGHRPQAARSRSLARPKCSDCGDDLGSCVVNFRIVGESAEAESDRAACFLA
jgi:hypothetical protein